MLVAATLVGLWNAPLHRRRWDELWWHITHHPDPISAVRADAHVHIVLERNRNGTETWHDVRRRSLSPEMQGVNEGARQRHALMSGMRLSPTAVGANRLNAGLLSTLVSAALFACDSVARLDVDI